MRSRIAIRVGFDAEDARDYLRAGLISLYGDPTQLDNRVRAMLEQDEDLLWRWAVTEAEASYWEVISIAQSLDSQYPSNLKEAVAIQCIGKLSAFLEEEIEDIADITKETYAYATIGAIAIIHHCINAKYVRGIHIKGMEIDAMEIHLLGPVILGLNFELMKEKTNIDKRDTIAYLF